MATTIKLKNSVTTTNAPSSLVQGEVAINVTDKKVWVGNAATTPIQLLGGGADGSFTNISVSSVATFGAGTVSAPSITTTGDTNTGIFFPTADTIAFTEGGVESMRIDSSGNVGIGTSSPTARLGIPIPEFSASSTSGMFRFQNPNVPADSCIQSYYVSSDGSDINIGANSYVNTAGSTARFSNSYASSAINIRRDGVLVFRTNTSAGDATERMRIDSSGNVGIGTSSPNGKVDIVSSSAGANTNTLFLTNSSGTAGTATSLVFGVGSDPTNRQAVIRGINAGGNAINLAFLTSNADVPAERMRITSGGDVGIGTSSPAAKLDIRGSSPELYVAQDGSNNGVALAWDNSNAFAKINTIGAAWPILFLQNGTERMRITSGGEVYIAGTADQGAYNLQCNGTGVWGAGAYVNGSDERIKDDITPLDSGLDVVAKLNPVTYKYKEDWSKDQSTQTGFIAQELLTALEGKNYVDGVVQQGGQYMSVAYQNIIPILTKAIQEQQVLINQLTTRLNALEGN